MKVYNLECRWGDEMQVHLYQARFDSCASLVVDLSGNPLDTTSSGEAPVSNKYLDFIQI